MIYHIGDKLKCKTEINIQCLEMCNPCFDIKVGDTYTVTDKDDYPDDNHCQWYELTSNKDSNVILSAWNGEGHMIVDDTFEKQ